MERLFPNFFFCLVLLATSFWSAPSAEAAAGSITLNGQPYTSMESIKSALGFTSLKTNGRNIHLEKKGVRIVFYSGSHNVMMNRIKFVFSFPVRRSGSSYYVHTTDFEKLIVPIFRPAKGFFDTVIIDPGHGGHDPGAVSPHGIGREKDFALKVAINLSNKLRASGYKVGLTRRKDRFLTLQQRVDYANKYPNAIFISIHFNSAASRQATGIETFTLSPKGVAHYGKGVKASDFVNKLGNGHDAANIALATAVHSKCIVNTKCVDRGVRRARFSVLSNVKHPAILLEGGFLSNRTEASRIASGKYQEQLAVSIYQAVQHYKHTLARVQR